ncbi:hypothetical protein EB796_018570 [Bugula neritina]|uniref:CCHC-type domain-containing protein n=1 Tax=Bugula neritina TaxID=10212 RepID=A0A7J7JBW3_BUGNE|nr:hypothetical protein EB796_018570 [Bugula neritina]
MDIAKLVATEQFISCPDDLAVHLKQSSYNSSEDMCDAASLFLHARGRKLAKTKKTNTKRMENTPAGSMHAEQGSKSDGACFICKDKSHIARNCPRRGKKYCSHCKMNNHNTSDCRKYGGRSVHAAAAIATTQNKIGVTDPGISSKVEEPTEITVNGKKFVNAAVCKNDLISKMGAQRYLMRKLMANELL